jgi:chromosome segregation ATPase
VSLQQLPSSHSPPPPRSASSPASLTESLLGASWHEEDPPTSASALQMEALQSQLKRREGEVALLRGEARRLELQRAELMHQVATLSARSDAQAAELLRLKQLEPKYDALLQMYGEQLEVNQELRLDLDDVKEMYRSQIEALLASTNVAPQ